MKGLGYCNRCMPLQFQDVHSCHEKKPTLEDEYVSHFGLSRLIIIRFALFCLIITSR